VSRLLALALVASTLAPVTAEAKPRTDLCAKVVAATWPASLQRRAARVCRCESSGNPNAKNPRSTARGLFQVLAGTWRDYAKAGEDIWNPYDNSTVGHRIQRGQGWGAWEESRGCWA
jgi:soluble lytic murein transglycosylase-like protein